MTSFLIATLSEQPFEASCKEPLPSLSHATIHVWGLFVPPPKESDLFLLLVLSISVHLEVLALCWIGDGIGHQYYVWNVWLLNIRRFVCYWVLVIYALAILTLMKWWRNYACMIHYIDIYKYLTRYLALSRFCCSVEVFWPIPSSPPFSNLLFFYLRAWPFLYVDDFSYSDSHIYRAHFDPRSLLSVYVPRSFCESQNRDHKHALRSYCFDNRFRFILKE